MIRTEHRKNVTLIHFDDGKANAWGFEAVEGITSALDEAEEKARAVVLAGRQGFFCAGFDLTVMSGGGRRMIDLLEGGSQLLARLSGCPLPVVAACTGHALAAGALLLLAADLRIGASGNFKVGLNEVAIGLPLPAFAVEMAKLRLSRRSLIEATGLSRLYSPAEAVDVGFLDRISDGDLAEEAFAAAEELTERLDGAAFAATRNATHSKLLAAFDGGPELAAFAARG